MTLLAAARKHLTQVQKLIFHLKSTFIILSTYTYNYFSVMRSSSKLMMLTVPNILPLVITEDLLSPAFPAQPVLPFSLRKRPPYGQTVATFSRLIKNSMETGPS